MSGYGVLFQFHVNQMEKVFNGIQIWTAWRDCKSHCPNFIQSSMSHCRALTSVTILKKAFCTALTLCSNAEGKSSRTILANFGPLIHLQYCVHITAPFPQAMASMKWACWFPSFFPLAVQPAVSPSGLILPSVAPRARAWSSGFFL